MPTLAAGSEGSARAACCGRAGFGLHRPGAAGDAGFTLIELMVVITLVAVAAATAVLSLRDGAAAALERDAQRLAAVLESARAQARASDTPVVWQAQDGGFVLRGLHRPPSPQPWLSPDTRSGTAATLVLGPEPLLPPQHVELQSAAQAGLRLWVGSDGLQPFAVQRAPAGQP